MVVELEYKHVIVLTEEDNIIPGAIVKEKSRKFLITNDKYLNGNSSSQTEFKNLISSLNFEYSWELGSSFNYDCKYDQRFSRGTIINQSFYNNQNWWWK